ncbi:Aspartate/glutamate leucyltransferase [wastewater metagenome]|uniref:Aspartate/glutamate leucyltransferase n=2 Tax=unclassified sequences TaxID=12908 RepID=A0A5B8R7V2_9ZZZZ|nr:MULTISPECIES: arginyltransferase [Arhodomonas]MCS4503214.1 arginyltransferase [Arhodomonas aquaeolei]QEA04750.1 aspartate/glutamate leucyltransferase [uncultured organism]
MTEGAPRRLAAYLTGEEPCPYLPDRQARTAFLDPEAAMSPALYGQLLAMGLRRSGAYVYRPLCPGCSACESLRIPVAAFRPRRRQRRARRAAAGWRVEVSPAHYDPAHYALFRRYIDSRHPEGGMADTDEAAYRRFLFADWCDTELIELHDGDHRVAVAVTDRVPDALSAVYTFFNPAYSFASPGTVAILLQLERAAALGLDWLYLGYWIAQAPTMRYKSEFTPHERFEPDGQWYRIEANGRRRLAPSEPVTR